MYVSVHVYQYYAHYIVHYSYTISILPIYFYFFRRCTAQRSSPMIVGLLLTAHCTTAASVCVQQTDTHAPCKSVP